MPNLFYAVDGVMLLLAAAATACAVAEMKQRVVKRWIILATGVLAALAAIALLSYPDVLDLLQLEVWSVAAAGILAGAARGQFMGMDSDHNWRLVRLNWAHDWLWVAIAVLLLAILQFAIEIRLRQLNPFETTVELPTVLASGYLLGGSIVAWFRAGSIAHTDLHE
jgi:hypothetical protein